MEINRLFYDFLINLKFPEFYAEAFNLMALSLVVLLISILLNFLSKKIISNFFVKLSSKTKNNFDDYLISNRAQIYISKLIPVLFTYWIIPFWINHWKRNKHVFNCYGSFISSYFIDF